MIDASKLLAFANKLEDDYKEQGYKWLYDKLRYEIVRQNQTELNNNDALDLVSGISLEELKNLKEVYKERKERSGKATSYREAHDEQIREGVIDHLIALINYR